MAPAASTSAALALLACVLASGCRKPAPTLPASSESGVPDALPAFRHTAVTKQEKRCRKLDCFCAEPLGCGKDEPCITYDENVAAFRTALKGVGSGKERRTVSCNHAEVGACGAYRYFFFDGDIHRTELRFFDEKGKFIGEIARTDYGEYCNGAASQRVRGAIPRCTLVRTELICGKPRELGGLIDVVLGD
jgi:hypothetical protein